MPLNYSLTDLIRDIESRPVEKGAHLYHPIPYPEFQHLTISSSRKGVMDKWDRIYKVGIQLFSSIEGLKVLDIGANAGFYTFNLAMKGAFVTAFEPNPRYRIIGQNVARLKSPTTIWRPETFNRFVTLEEESYDLCLCLSTYQWMAKGGKKILEASKDLRKISEVSDYLLFELGYNRGTSHLSTCRWNHYSALIDHLRESTEYKYFRLLGFTRVWRSAKRYLILCSNDPGWDDKMIMRWWRSLRI